MGLAIELAKYLQNDKSVGVPKQSNTRRHDMTSHQDMTSETRERRIGILPTQLLLEKCCSVGCSYMDMAKVC